MAKDKPNLNNVECDSKNNNIGAEIKKMQKIESYFHELE